MMVLETERLLLRFVEPSDLDSLAPIYADPEVMRFVVGALDRNGCWDRIQRMRELYRTRRCGPYALTLRETGEWIGRAGFLFWTVEGRAEVEVAYLLARAHWGQGFAPEAVRALVRYGFHRMRFFRLIALIHPQNTASIRVAEKAGLRLEKETLLPAGLRLIYSIEDARPCASSNRLSSAALSP